MPHDKSLRSATFAIPNLSSFQVGLGVLLAVGLLFPVAVQAQSTGSAKKFELVRDLRLTDFRGREWSLGEFDDKPFLVVAFLGTECPLAQFYSLRLAELSLTFADRQVQFVAIDANVQDSLEDMGAFAKRQGIEFPFLKDPEGRMADDLGATRTPEVFVLDRDRSICYQGRIDDQYGVGYTRKSPQSQELRDALGACLDGKPVTTTSVPAVGCLIGRTRKATANADIDFVKVVQPIVNEHCVRCHRAGQIGPFSLEGAEDIVAWSAMIKEVVSEGRMPPWHASPEHGQFANDCSLAPEDKSQLLAWIDAGAPVSTNAASAEIPLPKFVEGWQTVRSPDFECFVTESPVEVKSTGDIEYQYFVVDPKFTETKWIQTAELRPGNFGVVHHILCFVLPPGARDLEQELDGFLVGYVPGMLPISLPDGCAKKISAGSKLVFQVHYTPNGRPQTDHSRLGLVFADPKTVTHEVVTTCSVNPRISIPPNAENHELLANNRIPLGEWQLLSLMPHMHLRGKAFRYTAFYPDGQEEILLDVPRYDFNWQTSYQLSEPKTIPKGTKIICAAIFDNSVNNLNNPDPTRTVKWGDQTWEEMMIGYFDMAIPVAEAARLEPPNRRRR